MTERDKIILAIYHHEENDNMAFLDHYMDPVANLVTEMTEKLATAKVDLQRHEDFYELHYFKFVLQCLSLKHLFQGTPLNSIKLDFKFRDLSSIYNGCRALMETFLTINYLYYNHKSTDQAMFRYLLYVASGLHARQSYPSNEDESKEKKEHEKNELEKIIAEIQSNSYFKSVHPDKQKYMLTKIQAYEMGMKEMITESRLDNEAFHTMWKLYSNYSHSEYIEAMQIRNYLNNPTQHNGVLYHAFRLCFMLLCYQVVKLSEKFEIAKKVFDEQTLVTRTMIEFYNNLIYGIKLGKP
jgi:hypothetical protein